jgi:hypothetical protein
LNYIETLLQERQALRAEVQQARDEIAHLQGQKARPTFKANRPAPVLHPHPAARAAKKVATSDTPLSPRAERIKIDREAVIPLDHASWPPNFRSTGYRLDAATPSTRGSSMKPTCWQVCRDSPSGSSYAPSS